jgi:hypothetical protein
MFLSSVIKEYNLNIINLNYLLTEFTIKNINNFLYDNNLDYNIKKNDLNKIINHFIITDIIDNFKEEYNNILIFNESIFLQEEIYIIHTLLINLNKILKKFNFNLLHIETNFIVDKNTIYEIKSILQNKRKTNLRKIKEFCNENELIKLAEEIKNNLKTKIILHK